MNDVTIERCYGFEAAHFLPYVADGHKCKRVHGHSYTLRVEVTGPVQESGPEQGMVVDFAVIDAAGAALCAKIDHTLLNESVTPNPTVELMAPIFQAHFSEAIGRGLHIRVVLEEGPRSKCTHPPR